MFKHWLLLVLLANALFAEALLAQEALQLPTDPMAAIAALPIAAPVANGSHITVIDALTKAPIANADVIIVPHFRDAEAKHRQIEKAMIAQNAEQSQLRYFAAAVLGTRYQSNAQGTVWIPKTNRESALGISGTKIGLWRAETGGPLKLSAPTFVTVQVRNSRGKPARNVEVGLGRRQHYQMPQVRARTEGHGVAVRGAGVGGGAGSAGWWGWLARGVISAHAGGSGGGCRVAVGEWSA